MRAWALRKYLGLGIEPVASMRDVVEKDFGIRVVWVTEDHLDRSIDGACTTEPRAAMLVNLLEPERFPWRTRITLAHELSHLLFDDEVRTRRALVSPYGKSGVSALHLDELERNARAFAACFLAPAEGVRGVVGAADRTSEEAVRRVGSTFGVGRTVAINRLQHVFGFSDAQRKAMETRAAEPYDGHFDGDTVVGPLGYRGGDLYRLVNDAIRDNRISGTRARRLLGLTPADALPYVDLDEAARAPLISPEERVRRCGDALLRADPEREGLVAARAERDGDRWRVVVMGGGIGARELMDQGHLVLSATGDLIEDHVRRRGSRGPSTTA
jgi:Zn-dependent peptidase ImmA (M78 family)